MTRRALRSAALLAVFSLAACDGLFEPGERAQEKILFLRYTDPQRLNSPRDSADIYVVKANGTGLRNVTGHLAQYSSVTPSPDGRSVVFQSNRGGAGTFLWLMSSDGSGLRQLTTVSSGAPQWSPDGSRIAFMMGGHVNVMNADGTNPLMVSAPVMQVGTSCGSTSTNIVLVGWIGSSRIAFARGYCGYGYRYFTVNADGTGFAETSIRLFEAFWSPDGSKVVFPRHDGQYWRVILMNADGTGERVLSTQGTHQGLPWGNYTPWSPDGERIVFFADSRTEQQPSERGCNQWVLPYVVNVDGSGVQRLLETCTGYFNGWAPSGDQVAFTLWPQSGPPDVYAVNADGTGAVNVSRSSFWDSDGQWLPR